MSEAARARAEELRALPHVKHWMKRFKKIAKDMPPEVWVYIASGTPHVMAFDQDRKMFERAMGGGSDQDAIIESLNRSDGSWDGGDW